MLRFQEKVRTGNTASSALGCVSAKLTNFLLLRVNHVSKSENRLPEDIHFSSENAITYWVIA